MFVTKAVQTTISEDSPYASTGTPLAQCAQLLALPTDPRQIAEQYTFTPADLDLIAKCRGGPNRLGFAVQLGLLRYPGRAWTPLESVPLPLLQFIAAQVGVSPGRLTEYGTRDETRREHRDQGEIISDDLLAHLSPLGWEHINLTGDYIWNSDVTEDLPPSRQLTLPFLGYPEA